MKEDAEGHRDELAEARKIADDALRDAKQLEERWDRLSEVESREVLWQRPCGTAVPKLLLPPGDASGPAIIRRAGKLPNGSDQNAMAAVPHGHPMLAESCEIGGDAQLLCASM